MPPQQIAARAQLIERGLHRAGDGADLKRCLDQPVSEQFEEQRSAVFGPDVLRQQLQGTRDGRLL